MAYIGNVPSHGEFKKADSIASSFNGSLTAFDLDVNAVNQTVGDASQLIISLNGIVQEPGTAYTLGIGGGSVVFASAPASTDACHIVILGGVGDSGTPADIVWLYARTGTDSKGRAELTTFLVERGMEGYSVGQKIYDKAGMRASNTAELVFDNCIVPNENVVGNPGESMIHMMRNLEIERIALAAMSLGIARRSLSAMNKYASEREAFGNQIRDFGQIQRHIGESYAEYRAMRAYIYDTAANTNLSMAGNRLDSDGVKLFATTAAKNIADRAIQVMGGYGYVGEYVVERLWRDSKLLEIGGGTLEGHHKNITRDLAKNSSNIDG
jgi:isovaleryl-CoA dehydrogenase